MDAKSSLRDLQEQFSRFLYTARPSPEQETWIERFVQMDSLSEAQSRLRIYRKNLIASLTGVLRATFPVTERVLTGEIFKKIAREYIYEHPSTQYDLNRYGSHFVEFIRRREDTQSLPFIPDLASLEWAWSECLDSEEDVPLSHEEFEKILKAYDPARFIFRLRKFSRVVTTSYTVLKFWMESKDSKGHEGSQASGEDKIPRAPQHLFVWKDRDQRRIQEIEAELWPVFLGVQQRLSLKDLSELPVVLNNSLLLKESLQVMLTRGWLSK